MRSSRSRPPRRAAAAGAEGRGARPMDGKTVVFVVRGRSRRAPRGHAPAARTATRSDVLSGLNAGERVVRRRRRRRSRTATVSDQSKPVRQSTEHSSMSHAGHAFAICTRTITAAASASTCCRA